ncbi:MAG: flagellar biosynthesis anti-sigma factor FlgM, partial [Clostridiales bacterium]|nr:flagellar biosynthesis anti-sigma factor FlgM [Clostridiales bacterium]
IIVNIEKFGLYNKNSIAGGYPAKKASRSSKASGSFAEQLSKTQKMDTIEISSVSFDSQAPLSEIKNEIVSSMNEPSNAEHIAQVKQQVASGTYNINAHDLAGILLAY